MTYQEYREIENYMLSQMQDSAHDKHHIYRVLNAALDISNYETAVDFYNGLFNEISQNYKNGLERLSEVLN